MENDLEFEAASDSNGSYVDGISPRLPGTFEPRFSWRVLALNGANEGCFRGVLDQQSDGRLLFTQNPFEYPIHKGDRFVLKAAHMSVSMIPSWTAAPMKFPIYLTKAQLADEFEKLAQEIVNRQIQLYENIQWVPDYLEPAVLALQNRATELRSEAKEGD